MPAQRRATGADLRDVQAFLHEWARVVDATTEINRVDALNEMLARFTVSPSITNHDGSGWHLHYRDPHAGFAATLAGGPAPLRPNTSPNAECIASTAAQPKTVYTPLLTSVDRERRDTAPTTAPTATPFADTEPRRERHRTRLTQRAPPPSTTS